MKNLLKCQGLQICQNGNNKHLLPQCLEVSCQIACKLIIFLGICGGYAHFAKSQQTHNSRIIIAQAITKWQMQDRHIVQISTVGTQIIQANSAVKFFLVQHCCI